MKIPKTKITNEMIDKAARAICESRFGYKWDKASNTDHYECLEDARFALEAALKGSKNICGND